jgi:type II secretory pathway pseudopilin PulG
LAGDLIFNGCSTTEMPRRYSSSSFTLVELLATIAIAAVLIALAMFFTASYTLWARQSVDHEVYAVLNDELTRYKGNGGNLTALTAGAPMSDIFAQLKTPVVPAGMPASLAQQFMANNYTFPGRSLFAAGSGQQYHIYQVDRYNDGSGGSGGSSYGAGVGYMSNGGAAGGYPMFITSTSGYYTVLPAGGTQIINASNSYCVVGVASSVTFWSSDGSGNPTGTIKTLIVEFDHLTSLNVSALTSLHALFCDSNSLSSLNASGLTNLIILFCYSNNAGMTINITGDYALPAPCTNKTSTNFQIDPGAVVTGP